jgi:hypothetical protein
MNGVAGISGTNGTNGTNGTEGVDGAPGVAGTNGAVGATGANGAAGINGTNGTNGSSSTPSVAPILPVRQEPEMVPLPTREHTVALVLLPVAVPPSAPVSETDSSPIATADTVEAVITAPVNVARELNDLDLPTAADPTPIPPPKLALPTRKHLPRQDRN